MRADPRFIGFDDGVERGRIDIALLGENGFERAHAQLHLGQFRAVLVIVVVMMMTVVVLGSSHGMSTQNGIPINASGDPCHKSPTLFIRRPMRPTQYGSRLGTCRE